MSKPRMALVVVALFAALGGVAVAVAAPVPGPDGKVYLCYNDEAIGHPEDLATLIVTTPEVGCAVESHPDLLTLNQVGPQGPAGAPGPQGAQGPVGSPGELTLEQQLFALALERAKEIEASVNETIRRMRRSNDRIRRMIAEQGQARADNVARKTEQAGELAQKLAVTMRMSVEENRKLLEALRGSAR